MGQDQPIEWLLACLRTGGTDERSARLGRLSESDRRQVFDVAMRNDVAPLLYSRLKPLALGCDFPLGVLQKLRVVYVANAARNMKIYHELGEVLTALQQAGAPVIVLKGAYVAGVVYPSIALRAIGDVDLLVPRAELPRAQAILLDMGGIHQQPEDIESCCWRSHHLPPVVVRGLPIELHWTITPPTGSVRIDAAGLWERAQPATVAGVQVLALSPEDLLLHLCLHASHQHGLCLGLRPFCDIAEAIRHYGSELDWRQFADRACEWGASRYVSLTLHLARSLLAVPVPEDVVGQLVPEGLDSRLLKKATECVLAQERYGSWALLPFPNTWGDKTTWEKAKALWDAVFISRDQMAVVYPKSRDSRHLWPYYVWRPVDLLRKYGRATLRQGFRLMRIHKRDSTPSLAKWLRSGERHLPARISGTES